MSHSVPSHLKWTFVLLYIFYMFSTHFLNVYSLHVFYTFLFTFWTFSTYFYTLSLCFLHHFLHFFQIFYTVTYRAVLPLLYTDPKDLSGKFLQGRSYPFGQLPETFVAWSVPNFFSRVSNVQNLRNKQIYVNICFCPSNCLR